MKRSYIIAGCLIVLLSGYAAYLYLRDANIPVLQPAGPVASGELQVIIITLLLCSIVVVPVFVLLFLFAWKYRADNPEIAQDHRPDWDHSSPWLEFVWWLVPSAIVAVLAVVAWQSSHALDPYVPLEGSGTPITIQVVALDWKWLFIYPDEGIATVNYLEFPVESPVHFELTADAPMNSFWIPALGGQIMAMPGMTTQLNLLASRVGIFDGSSANISGAGFAGMSFTAKAVSESDYEQWVNAVKSSSQPLSADAYETLEAPSSYDAVASYSPVAPDLYTSINMKFMMPGGLMIAALPSQPAPQTPSQSAAPSSARPAQDTNSMDGMQMNMPMENQSTQ